MNHTRLLFSVGSITLFLAAAASAADSKAAPPADPCRIEVLNNLVSELMNAGKRGLLGQPEIPFVNPRKGWCFFALAGDAVLTLDKERRPLAAAKGSATVEAMRFLPAGRHTLKVSGRAEKLVVRAIPVLIYNAYRASSTIAPFGVQTWEMLRKGILPNCNMIEIGVEYPKEMAPWCAEGKQWIASAGVPNMFAPRGTPLEDAYQYYRKSLGYTHPLLTGIQVDEFYPAIRTEVVDNAIGGATRLAADPAFHGRQWIPFVDGMVGRPQLLQAVIKADWPFSIELYFPEQPTEAADRAALMRDLAGECRRYEIAVPGCMKKAIVTPMYSSLPTCMTNTSPSADFKIHLDMQMEILANEPVFAGLYGVQPYRSNYADPETLRCSALLLRHYCIEGRKDRCFHDPYELKHILNPDFDDGTAHWELQPAEPGSISPGKKIGYKVLQGRWPASQRCGRKFLVMKRNAQKPNTISQAIKNLQPGRLYSLKMITADRHELESGQSQRALHAVSIRLEGVKLRSGPQEAFCYPFQSTEKAAGFTAAKPLWMNYHWQVFQATDSPARLTVTDWKSDSEPGGPAGQELVFNFLELQPYLDDI